MKGRQIIYGDLELIWIRANSKRPRAEAHALFCELFGRDDVSLTNFHALCKRKGWMTGRTGCFPKGQTPHNKGKPMPYHPNSAATRFKVGGMSGRAQKRYQPIGTERMSKDGYLERKTHDGEPRNSRWRAVHLIEWEAVNGPIPRGQALKCLDGDRTNTAPGNWECVPRALLPRLNGRFGRGYDEAPAELRPTIMAVVKLEHRAREAKKGKPAPVTPKVDA